jgi:hypothetical protein
VGQTERLKSPLLSLPSEAGSELIDHLPRSPAARPANTPRRHGASLGSCLNLHRSAVLAPTRIQLEVRH